MEIVDSLVVKVNADISGAKKAIDSLKRQLQELKTQFNTVYEKAESIYDGIENGFSNAKDSAKNMCSALVVVGDSAKEASAQLPTIIAQLPVLSQASKDASSDSSYFADSLKLLGTTAESTGEKLYDFIEGEWTEVFPDKTDEIIEKMKQLQTKLKNLGASLKRMIMYRLVRMAVMGLVNALREGINAAYQWSKANDQVFAQTMDNYATDFQYFKDSAASMLIQMLESLYPLISKLLLFLSDLADKLAQLFAFLNGQNTYQKAVISQKEYAEATSDSAKAQKELNKQLAKFDQLNNLTTNDKKDNDSDYQLRYETAQINGWEIVGGVIEVWLLTTLLSTLKKVIITALGSKTVAEAIAGLQLNIGATIKSAVASLAKSEVFTAVATAFAEALVGVLSVLLLSFFASLYFDKKNQKILSNAEELGLGNAPDVDKVYAYYYGENSWLTPSIDQDRNEIAYWDNPSDGLSKALELTGSDDATEYFKKATLYKKEARLNKFAIGGFPDMGSMFIAGEVSGQAEFVGNINGRTGVASGQEITGIGEAIYATSDEEKQLLRALLQELRNKQLVISPSAQFGRVINKSTEMYKGVVG